MTGKSSSDRPSKKSVPGHIGTLFAERGYTFDRRCPYQGDDLRRRPQAMRPSPMLGWAMGANHCAIDGIRAERDFLPKVQEAKVPFLGLCLGGQTQARVLGGKVRPHADGRVDSVFSRTYPTEVDRILFVESDVVYKWHREGFTVPKIAKVLATGSVGPAPSRARHMSKAGRSSTSRSIAGVAPCSIALT